MENILYISMAPSSRVIGGGEHFIATLVQEFQGESNQFLVSNNKDLRKLSGVGDQNFCKYRSMGDIYTLLKFLYKEDYSTIVFNGMKSLRIMLILFFFKPQTRKVYIEHFLTSDVKLKNSFRLLLNKVIMFILLRLMDRVVCVSQAVKEFLRKKLLLRNSKLIVCYNGVEIGQGNSKRELRNNRLITIGDYNYTKNYDNLFRVLDLLLNEYQIEIHLDVIGSGVEQGLLQSDWADKIPVEIITFWESLSHKRTLNVISAGGIYVQTSFSESFGLGVAEAMSFGLPVVAYRVGGLKELIEDGKTGFLINPYDVEEFSKKIQLLVKKPYVAKKMGYEGRQRIIQNFTLEHMLNKYRKILQI